MPTDPPSDAPALSEQDLQAFADGLLDDERAAQVQRYLKEHPDEAHRVAFYGRVNRDMQNAFARTEDAPLSARRPRFSLRGALRRFRIILVVLVVALAVAGVYGLLTHVAERTLYDASVAALDQALAAGPEAGGAADAAALAGAPDLTNVGFRAVSRRTMGIGMFSQASVIVYRNAQGEPAVLLSVPDTTVHSQPEWQARRIGENRLLVWTSGGVRHVFAGRANTRGLMRGADLMTAG
jgi:hypothetical protein